MLGYELFESNTVGDDSTYPVSTTHFIAQSFTAGTAHNLFTFCFNLIKWGTPSDATIRIYNVDSHGKPSGIALATMIIPTAEIGTTTTWPYDELEESLLAKNTQLIAVLSGSVLELEMGARYQSVGTYTAGKAWYSNDIGATWHELTSMSFLFQDWGQALPLYGTYRIPLYPAGAGTFTQLVGALNAAGKPNYAYVNDPIDAVDDNPLNSVCYELCDVFKKSSDSAVFLSGLSDGAAGRLTGTTLLWKNSVAGVWGKDTTLLTQLVASMILRSPSKNEWYKGTSLRLSKVSSISSDLAATLVTPPGDFHEAGDEYSRKVLEGMWFYFPNNFASATAGWGRSNPMAMLDYPGYLPLAFMPGVWEWTTRSDVVTATGGSALSIYPDPDWVLQYIGRQSNQHIGDSEAYPVLSVDGDNQVTLWDDYGGGSHAGLKRDTPDSFTTYAYQGFKDDLSSDVTATQWSLKEKMDSYAIKTTLNEGNIYRMYAHFRACVKWADTRTPESYFPTQLTFYINCLKQFAAPNLLTTAWFGFYKAKYLLYLTNIKNELLSLTATYPTLNTTYAIACADTTHALVTAATIGDAAMVDSFNALYAAVNSVSYSYLTIADITPSGTAKPFVYLNGLFSYGTEQTVKADMGSLRIYDFEVAVGRPGGGIFTKDDLPDMEVGIILGNINDINKVVAVCCTQICLIAEVSNLPSYMLTRHTGGLDDMGFLAFKDHWDEFNQYVGGDGVNTLGWKVHYPLYSHWVFRPLMKIRQGIRKIFTPSHILRLRRR